MRTEGSEKLDPVSLVSKRLSEEFGDRFDSATINLIAAEAFFVVGLVTIMVLTWPHPPWDAMFWGGIALMIVLPIVSFPFSKTLWLAFDLIFRPSLPGDYGQRSGS